MSDTPKPKPTRRKAVKSGGRRRPHNAKRSTAARSIEELVLEIGAEPIQVVRAGQPVTMTRLERNIRAELDAALAGEVRALKHLLAMMSKHPDLLAREVVITQMLIPEVLANL